MLAKPLLSVNICFFFDPNWVDKKAVGLVLFCVDCFDGDRCIRAECSGHRIRIQLQLQIPLTPAHDGGQGDAGHEEETDQGDQEGEDDIRCAGS